ncbi:hypothetical protein CHH55_09850 [Niallia circulans]|uniref:hypothetical protein n=1 Tax=Niallia circulans TaxID=1397 RepID=UPI000BA5FAB9|nr:hypothetical protein [Niallia circulans]PAD88055.1 hypothetical protein CHH55_09850 [Niallia circulans]
MNQKELEELVRRIVQELILEKEPTFLPAVHKPKVYILAEMSSEIMADMDEVGKQYQLVFIDEISDSLSRRAYDKEFLLIPQISKSNLAKTALGIADNRETEIIQQCLNMGMEIILWKEGLSSSSPHSTLAYSKLFVAYERLIQEFGITITKKKDFLQRFQEKQQRVLTAKDIDGLSPNSFYKVDKEIMITNLAQEQLKEKNIQLICE